jgi:tetratricopeptide (TPR) repeat protein
MTQSATLKREPKQDFEALTVILSVAMVVALLSLITNLRTEINAGGHLSASGMQGYTMPAHLRNQNKTHQPNPVTGPKQAFREAFHEPQSELEKHVDERFQQAIGLLHAKQYNYAITALDAVLEMVPDMPEAYVNMGYAFIGLKEFGPARGAFEKAIELKVDQVNAYYGLAIAFEGSGDLEAALGAMRSYIHLSPPDDPFLPKARSALWEWEGQLGRIKGVETAPEGVEGESIKAPFKWSDEHHSPDEQKSP